jgi:hypothetical protein
LGLKTLIDQPTDRPPAKHQGKEEEEAEEEENGSLVVETLQVYHPPFIMVVVGLRLLDLVLAADPWFLGFASANFSNHDDDGDEANPAKATRINAADAPRRLHQAVLFRVPHGRPILRAAATQRA